MLCLWPAVCIRNEILCIRPSVMHTGGRMHRHTDAMHTATFYTIPAGVIVGGIFALSFSVCQCPWVDHGLWPRECRRYFLSIPVHLCMCLCVLCLILLATVQTLSLTSPLVHGNSLTSRPSALLATSLSPSSFPFSSGLPVCWTSPLVNGNSLISPPSPVSSSSSLQFL